MALERGDAEQVVDPLSSDPDHQAGASSTAAATAGGSGARHAGQETARRDISVLHRGQCTARPRSGSGIHSGGGGPAATGGGGGVGNTGGGTGAYRGGGGADTTAPELDSGAFARSAGSPCGTVAPQREQNSAPGAATAPQRGQTITPRQTICAI